MDPEAQIAKTIADLQAKQISQDGAITQLRQAMTEQNKAQEIRIQAAQDARLGPESENQFYRGFSDEERLIAGDNKRAPRYLHGLRLLSVAVPTGIAGLDDHRPGLIDDPNPRTESQKLLQRAVTTRNFARKVMRVMGLEPNEIVTPRLDFECARALEMCRAGTLFTDTATQGGEWIPDNHLPGIDAALRLPTGLRQLVRQQTLPPGGTFTKSYESAIPWPVRSNVQTVVNPPSIDVAAPTTGSRTLTGTKIRAGIQCDRLALANTLLTAAAELENLLVMAVRYGVDFGIMHGDTAGTHQDTISAWNPRSLFSGTIPAAGNHPATGWMGFRPRAFDNSATATPAATFAGIMTTLIAGKMNAVSMGKLGTDALVLFASPEFVVGTISGFAELKTNDLATRSFVGVGLQNFGSGAPMSVPGFVGRMANMPVIMNPMITQDLNASGIFDNVTKTKTCVVAVDLDRWEWWQGQPQGATVEVEDSIGNDTRLLIANAFGTLSQVGLSTEKTVAVGYNL